MPIREHDMSAETRAASVGGRAKPAVAGEKPMAEDRSVDFDTLQQGEHEGASESMDVLLGGSQEYSAVADA